MIIITKIEILKTEKDFNEMIELSYNPNTQFIHFNDHTKIEDIKTIKELIKGKRFVCSERNIDVIIGISGEAQKIIELILKIQNDEFNNLQKENTHLTIERNCYFEQIKEIQSYGFWKRLKCLFKGIN
jgi:hypothetical protein